MKRLSDTTLGNVPAHVLRPDYDRRALSAGVVHFGPGAFHRAHQAAYLDRVLSARPDLAICAVALRTPDVANALAPQDGLYALVEREADPTVRIIGAIREVRVAPRDPGAVLARLDAARLVTATVTEKGYGLTPSGDLDFANPDIAQDIRAPAAPVSFPGWLVASLRRRRATRRAAFVTVSCDNLSGNGGRLHRAVTALARAQGDADLADWIEAEAAFPNSMVDSITPATDEALRAEAAAALGLTDAWPVQRERFMQWVVEDRLAAADSDALASAGVTLAGDVAPFERAKLRILNGAHSTLAYLGLRLGHETVSGAMDDARLAGFIERLMRQDMIPGLASPGQDLRAYAGGILARFRNPAIVHRLSQIAWDGSQKLRFRLLEPVADALEAGRPVERLAVGVAAWMDFVRRAARDGRPITDPLADLLLAEGRRAGGGRGDVAQFLSLAAVFPSALAGHPGFRAALETAYVELAGTSPASVFDL